MSETPMIKKIVSESNDILSKSKIQAEEHYFSSFTQHSSMIYFALSQDLLFSECEFKYRI